MNSYRRGLRNGVLVNPKIFILEKVNFGPHIKCWSNLVNFGQTWSNVLQTCIIWCGSLHSMRGPILPFAPMKIYCPIFVNLREKLELLTLLSLTFSLFLAFSLLPHAHCPFFFSKMAHFPHFLLFFLPFSFLFLYSLFLIFPFIFSFSSPVLIKVGESSPHFPHAICHSLHFS